MKTKIFLTVGGWVVTIASAILGVAGVAIGNKQSEIQMQEEVKKEVARQLRDHNKYRGT